MKFLHILPWAYFGGTPNYVKGLLKGLKISGHRNICIGREEHFNTYGPHSNVYIPVKSDLIKPFDKFLPDFAKVRLYSFSRINLHVVVKSYEVHSIIFNNDPRITHLEHLLKCEIPVFRIQHGTYINYLHWYKHLPIPSIDRVKELSHVLLYHYDILRYLRLLAKQYPNFYIVAVSKRTRKELIYYGIPPSKVYVVTGGVDKDIFKPISKDEARRALSKLFGIRLGEDDSVILHIGLSPIKGTHILLKALKMITSFRKVKTLIIGSPKGVYCKHLSDLMRKVSTYKNVFMLGKVPDNLMPLLYNVADVVVQPSYSEGGPLTMLESLACGTPVITTDVGCSEDYLKTIGLGYLLIGINKPDFSNELADKVIHALENREHYHQKVLSNRDKIPSWIQIAEQYANLVKNWNKYPYEGL